MSSVHPPSAMPSAAAAAVANPKQGDGDYQQHVHIFRGIAIILIVCAHTVPSLDWSQNPHLGVFIDAIANQTSIFFFFIAGYLFQHLSGRFAFGPYLQQKFKTVILPYLLLSIPALIVFTLLTRRIGMWSWFYDLPIWQQIGLFLLTGKHLAPLWFVPTIALFYLAAPLLLWIDRRWPRGYWAILPLLALATYTGRGGPLGPLNIAPYLLPVYLLGMLFSRHKQQARALVQRWWPVLALVVVGCLAGEFYDWRQPPYRQVLLKTALALLITVALWHTHHLIGKRLDTIAELSFGIFFIHAYFISAIKVATVYLLLGRAYTGEGGEVIPGTLLNFVLYAGSVLALSVLTLLLVKRVLGRRSRMLVGA